MENVPEAEAVGLSSTESMRRSIRNQRQDRHQHLNPVTGTAISEIPQEIQQKQYGEYLLFFDIEVGDKNHLILFGAEYAIEYLRQSSHKLDDIMTDFEIASINAAAANYPDIEKKSCFYRSSENLWKRIQRTGLQERYTNEEDFANALLIISALAFVQPCCNLL